MIKSQFKIIWKNRNLVEMISLKKNYHLKNYEFVSLKKIL